MGLKSPRQHGEKGMWDSNPRNNMWEGQGGSGPWLYLGGVFKVFLVVILQTYQSDSWWCPFAMPPGQKDWNFSAATAGALGFWRFWPENLKKYKKRNPFKRKKRDSHAQDKYKAVTSRIRQLGTSRRNRPLALPWRGFQGVSHDGTSNRPKW